MPRSDHNEEQASHLAALSYSYFFFCFLHSVLLVVESCSGSCACGCLACYTWRSAMRLCIMNPHPGKVVSATWTIFGHADRLCVGPMSMASFGSSEKKFPNDLHRGQRPLHSQPHDTRTHADAHARTHAARTRTCTWPPLPRGSGRPFCLREPPCS